MAATAQTPNQTAKTVPSDVIARRTILERVAYAAATIGIAAGPQLDTSGGTALLAGGTIALTGGWLYTQSKDLGNTEASLGLMRASQRAVPFLTGASVYLADMLHHGFSWWEIAAPAIWGALMVKVAPIVRSQNLTPETMAPPQATPPSSDSPRRPRNYEEFLAYLWDTSQIAPGTQLTAVEQFSHDGPDFKAVVVAQRGKAVPSLSDRALAAVFDFPEGSVTLRPLPGSGPGRMLLTARPTQVDEVRQSESLEGLWADTVSRQGGAAPGVQLLDHRKEQGRIILLVASPAGQQIHLPHAKLCSALGVDDPTRLVIETDGVRKGVISVYANNPLMRVRKATREDLIMDDKGRINIGVRHDGKPSRVRLFDPDLGAVRGITAGATGAGKSVMQLLFLAAEKLSGVVSWVGDLQGGKSLPEAEGNVDWFAKGEFATLAMLLAAHAVMKYREVESRNRADFAINRPWPLLNITLDEINRLLSHPTEVIRKLAAHLIADIQKTGRKVGVGIRLAVQSLHLKDLGDEEAIRQQGKQGVVVLMRTLSSSTQAMGLDGIAPAGFQMENIPARIYEDGQIEALFNGEDDEDGESTAGMAYIFTDGRAEFMRTFYAEKVDGRYVDFIHLFGPEPPNTLTEGEIKAAGRFLAFRDDPKALAGLVMDVLTASGSKNGKGKGGGSVSLDGIGDLDVLAGGDDGDEVFGGDDDLDGFDIADLPFTIPVNTAPEALADQILQLLADGPKALKDLRAALPDYSAGSVGNAASALREQGRVVTVSRGVYQLAT